jgi:hypothetical protein
MITSRNAPRGVWENHFSTNTERKMHMTDHYRVSWRKGRRIGAQGIFYPDSVVVQAASEEEAIRKAYETHEHLFFAEAEKINQPKED